jgi:hypothetical protein
LELNAEEKAMNLKNEDLAKGLANAQSTLSNARESLERLLSERRLKNVELQRAQENMRILLEPSQQDSQSALLSLRAITKASVLEFTSMENPEQCLQLLGILISLLFGEAPEWKSLRKINTNEGLQVKLLNYDISSIPPRLGRQILKIIEVSKVDEKAVEKVSNVGKVLARWLLACIASIKVTVDYSKEIAQRDDLLYLMQGIGAQIEAQKPMLTTQKAHAENLQSQFDLSSTHLQSLQHAMSECLTDIMRCSNLLEAFENSVPDWTGRLEEQKDTERTHVADLVLACFFVSYLGILNSTERQKVMEMSFEICKEKKVHYNQGNVNQCLVTSKIVYNDWTLCGLPASAFSLENGLSIRSSFAWPLIYDPHDIATQWIKRMDQRNNLRIFNCSDTKNTLATLESAIIEGGSILLENLPALPASWLVSLLSRRSWTNRQALEVIFIDGRSIPVGPGFRVYATCKSPLQELSSFYFGAMTQVHFDVSLETVQIACGRLLASWCMNQSPVYADLVDVSFVQSVKQLLEIDEKRQQMLMIPLTKMIQEDSYFIAALQSNSNLSMVTSKLHEVQMVVDALELSKRRCSKIVNALALIFVESQKLRLIDRRFLVSFQFFQDILSKLTEEIDFGVKNSGEKLFQHFASIFFENIAEMVPPEVFKSFIFDCAVTICQTDGLESDSDFIPFLPKSDHYQVSKSAWKFFENRMKTQIPLANSQPEHPYLSMQQLEKIWAIDKHIPSLNGIFQSVYDNYNLWRDWFGNGRFAMLKNCPETQNSKKSSFFDSLVILCCMFPSKEEIYKEEFCKLIFKTNAPVHGLNCLSSKTRSNFANLSYLLVDSTRNVDWIETIHEHLRFWKLDDNDAMQNVDCSVQNESHAERRLSNIIRANQHVIIHNVHQKFSWLQMLLIKLSRELEGSAASRVLVVLPAHQADVNFAPFYSNSRKVYCKAQLDFSDNVKLNAEIVLKNESKSIKLYVRKAIANFHSILGHEKIFCSISLEIGTRTLKNCLRTLEFLCASAADESLSQVDEHQIIMWAVSTHYEEYARDKIQLEQIMQLFRNCLQVEITQSNLARAEKFDILNIETFVEDLSTSTILEFSGLRKRNAAFPGPNIFCEHVRQLNGSTIDMIRQIQTLIPAKIILGNKKRKGSGIDVEWFLKAEVRIYNADIASITAVFEECLRFRVDIDFKAIHNSIACIMQDRVPPNFPNQLQESSSLRSLLHGLTRKRTYFQDWLNGGPPKCHDVSMYYDMRSFLAHLCVCSAQTSCQAYGFCLKVLRFENAGDVSAMASSNGTFVDGLLAYRCKWEPKRRQFCSSNAADEIFTRLPICLLSLDHGLHVTDVHRRSLPLYTFQCDGFEKSKKLAIASISVGIQDESVDMMVGSGACLACKHFA